MSQFNVKELLTKIYDHVNLPITFLDIETTGLDLMKDEVIQTYFCKFDGKDFIEDYSTYNVDATITKEAYGKHGLTKGDLVDFPYFKDDAKRIYEDFLSSGNVLCGFNSNNFDVPFLTEQLLKFGISAAVSIPRNKTIDVYKTYIEQNPNTLEAIYERITGGPLQGSHDAKADIGATITILDDILSKNPNSDILNESNHLDAGKFFKMEDGKAYFAKGMHKDKEILTMPAGDAISYLKWIQKSKTISVHTRAIAKKIEERLNKETVLQNLD